MCFPFVLRVLCHATAPKVTTEIKPPRVSQGKTGREFPEPGSSRIAPLNRTARVVGRASRLPPGRLALERTTVGETPGMTGETPAPLPAEVQGKAGETSRLKFTSPSAAMWP